MTLPVQETESKVAFTPGPWGFDGVWQIVEAGQPHSRVAFLPSDHAKYASSVSNGHLIAAAPEMYEALKRARGYVKPSHSGDVQADADLRAIDAALLKATGASS